MFAIHKLGIWNSDSAGGFGHVVFVGYPKLFASLFKSQGDLMVRVSISIEEETYDGFLRCIYILTGSHQCCCKRLGSSVPSL